VEELPTAFRHATPAQHRQRRAVASNVGTDYYAGLPKSNDLGRIKARRCGQFEFDRHSRALELFLNLADGKMGPVALV
jgi:hypothetical protein